MTETVRGRAPGAHIVIWHSFQPLPRRRRRTLPPSGMAPLARSLSPPHPSNSGTPSASVRPSASVHACPGASAHDLLAYLTNERRISRGPPMELRRIW